MNGYWLLRSALGPLIRRIWHLEVVGLERLPPGACVLAPNHVSLTDPFFVGAAVPRPLRFVAKAELFRWPLAPLLAWFGGIPVVRGEGDAGAIAAAVAALEAGETVVIHPQGTVLGRVDRPWKRGAARVAIATGVPIVPIRVVGSDRVLPPGGRRLRRARVAVVIGEAIPVRRAEPSGEAAADLIARVRGVVEAAPGTLA